MLLKSNSVLICYSHIYSVHECQTTKTKVNYYLLGNLACITRKLLRIVSQFIKLLRNHNEILLLLLLDRRNLLGR